MKKTFVIDTNVLLQSPCAIYHFEDNDVVIPAVVLEELDKFKKDSSELGANAREVSRILDDLRMTGNISTGVLLDSGGMLRIELNCENVRLPECWDPKKNDNRVLKVCLGLKEEGLNVILVSKDIFERIKAEIVGVTAQDFYAEQVPDYEQQYTGRCTVYAEDEKINGFYDFGYMDTDGLYLNYENSVMAGDYLTVNQFLIINSLTNNNHAALGRYDGNRVVKLWHSKERPFGVSPRNANQKFIQEALMMDSEQAPLVILKGPAGTAKTFYSLAVGLQQVLDEKAYRKILVCRPNVKMDEDIGFLPGTEQEKIAPYMRPIIDNLEILLDSENKDKFIHEHELRDKIQELFDRNIINTEAIAFIRGRSIVGQWVIIDEAQNLTPKQVKGIITRAGAGTKIILAGDPFQIDHPFLDTRTNGLCFAAEKMKGSKLAYQISLGEEDCERSPLSYESSKRM
ncbi:MAG: PhoH family protein [Clostridia bacterium]|nr:PhoH family protein [Clostridia bacterium]